MKLSLNAVGVNYLLFLPLQPSRSSSPRATALHSSWHTHTKVTDEGRERRRANQAHLKKLTQGVSDEKTSQHPANPYTRTRAYIQGVEVRMGKTAPIMCRKQLFPRYHLSCFSIPKWKLIFSSCSIRHQNRTFLLMSLIASSGQTHTHIHKHVRQPTKNLSLKIYRYGYHLPSWRWWWLTARCENGGTRSQKDVWVRRCDGQRIAQRGSVKNEFEAAHAHIYPCHHWWWQTHINMRAHALRPYRILFQQATRKQIQTERLSSFNWRDAVNFDNEGKKT